MISANGKLSNQLISPVSEKIQIESYVDADGNVITHGINYKKINYYLVEDGKRIAVLNDTPANWRTGQFFVTANEIDHAKAQQLNDLLVEIFESNIEVSNEG